MIYRYKATIPGSKSFLREYELRPDMTLFNFNTYIMNDLDFSPDQMVMFCAMDEKGKCVEKYGLFDFGNGAMDKVTFKDTITRGEQILQYVYDLRNQKCIILTYEGEYEEFVRCSYPRTIAEKGRNPEQFAEKYQDWDSIDEGSMIAGEEEVADFGENPDEE